MRAWPGIREERNTVDSSPWITVYRGRIALDSVDTWDNWFGGEFPDEEVLGPNGSESQKEHGSPYSRPCGTAYVGSGMLNFGWGSGTIRGMRVRIASQRVPQGISEDLLFWVIL